MAGALQASPQYGRRTKPANQTISNFSFAFLNWVDTVNTGPLTTNGVRYTNNTGRTLVVMVSYGVIWDPIIVGGSVLASIRQTSGGFPGVFLETNVLIPANVNVKCSCTATGILVLLDADYFECEVYNNNNQPLDVRGTGTFMTYYLLN